MIAELPSAGLPERAAGVQTSLHGCSQERQGQGWREASPRRSPPRSTKGPGEKGWIPSLLSQGRPHRGCRRMTGTALCSPGEEQAHRESPPAGAPFCLRRGWTRASRERTAASSTSRSRVTGGSGCLRGASRGLQSAGSRAPEESPLET